jgi:hypothetical protein
MVVFGCASGEDEKPARAGNEARQPGSVTPPVQTAELVARVEEPEPTTEPDEIETESDGREWKDPAGNVLAVGEFVSVMDEKVCLQTPDGLGAVVPLDKLCQADRDLVLGKPEADLTVEEEPQVVVEEMVTQIASTGPAVDAHYSREKVVIPFDFVSGYDDGRYGRKIGEQIVIKIQKQGTFVVPDAIDIRDVCAQHGVKITPNTPLTEVGRALRDLFDAHIAVWGSCEKVPGHERDVYDLTIKCADFSEALEPRMLYARNVRTKTVHEISHLHVKEMLDKLYGREPGGPEPVDPVVEENWLNNPTLVENGDFETGSRFVPNGWEDRGGQEREPLGNLVQWTTEAGNPNNRVIRFTFDESVGNGFGVMYYSKPFPIEEGATYRSQLRYRSNGPAIIVFVKCYDEMDSEYKPADQVSLPRHPLSREGGVEYMPRFGHLRECYRSQQNMKGPKNQWNTRTEDFTPKHTKYSPKWGRVMLYSYVGAGVVEFDDVVIKQIVPASAGDQNKDPRHSQDSAVTIKEMEENERRALEARQERLDR